MARTLRERAFAHSHLALSSQALGSGQVCSLRFATPWGGSGVPRLPSCWPHGYKQRAFSLKGIRFSVFTQFAIWKHSHPVSSPRRTPAVPIQCFLWSQPCRGLPFPWVTCLCSLATTLQTSCPVLCLERRDPALPVHTCKSRPFQSPGPVYTGPRSLADLCTGIWIPSACPGPGILFGTAPPTGFWLFWRWCHLKPGGQNREA